MGVGIKQKNDAVIREPFDYTEWQKDLFQGMSLDELGDKAMEFYNSQK